MMSIQQMYVQAHKIYDHGVEGYHVDNKYSDTRNQNNIPKKQLKRGSYLDDYAKIHGAIPGPGCYEYAPDAWPKKSRAKSAKPGSRKTYIDQLIQTSKKQKKPAPGHYKLGKSLKEIDEQRKKNMHKKIPYQDRITYLDGVQYEAAQTPGVGKYIMKQRPKTSSLIRPKPEEWRKKHEEQDKKKKKSKRYPDMGTYNPKEALSYQKKPGKDCQWGRVQRFKTDKSGSGLGPGKYLQFEDWTNKKSIAPRTSYKSTYYH